MTPYWGEGKTLPVNSSDREGPIRQRIAFGQVRPRSVKKGKVGLTRNKMGLVEESPGSCLPKKHNSFWGQ